MNVPPKDAQKIHTKSNMIYHIFEDGDDVGIIVGCHATTLTKCEANLIAMALLNITEKATL